MQADTETDEDQDDVGMNARPAKIETIAAAVDGDDDDGGKMRA